MPCGTCRAPVCGNRLGALIHRGTYFDSGEWEWVCCGLCRQTEPTAAEQAVIDELEADERAITFHHP